jgi:Na+-transporting methylmalonyl-CoA/oxaloacetate decarboxylase gamma subunit
MDIDALTQSLELLAIGMIVIFIFMSAMIVILHFFIKFATRFMPDKEDGEDEGSSGGSDLKNAEGAVVAAIAGAIKQKGNS